MGLGLGVSILLVRVVSKDLLVCEGYRGWSLYVRGLMFVIQRKLASVRVELLRLVSVWEVILLG